VVGIVRGEESPDLRNVRVTLDPLDDYPVDLHSSGVIDAADGFAIGNIPSGRYRVAAFGCPDGYYLKAVRWNGEDISLQGLSVSNNVAGLELILSKGAANLQGHLDPSEGKTLDGAVVTIAPQHGGQADLAQSRTVIVDQNGDFSLRNLAPGEYTVVGYTAEKALSDIAAKGESVSLSENGAQKISLKVVE
jgi:hypothetical protein